MSSPPRIIGFGGTTAPGSSSLKALRVALDAARAAGAETQLIDASELELPMYAWGATPPERAVAFAEAFHGADALVWSASLYHGTVSGLFKNALDWLELLARRDAPYLTGKPIGLIAVAGGAQSLGAITTMEQIARSLRAWTVPLVVPIQRSSEVFSSDGRVTDERVATQLASLGEETARAALAFRALRSASDERTSG
jgi:FMN reductase